MQDRAPSFRAGLIRVASAALTIAALTASLCVPTVARAVTGGPVIPVNTITAGVQATPAIAPDGSGGFIVAWESWEDLQEPCCPVDYNVFARRFDTSGEPLGGEIAVNTTTAGSQRSPVIAADSSGGFTVAWEGEGGIFARRFDASGAPLGGEIAVATAARDPAIAAAASGVFAIVWESEEQAGPIDLGRGVYMRRFDAAGEPLGGEVRVNQTKEGGQEAPAIAPDGSGGFIVAWVNDEPGESSPAFVLFRRFDAAGAPLNGETSVAPVTAAGQFGPAIAVEGSGGFTVLWQSGDLQARRFDASGAPLSGVIEVSPKSETDLVSQAQICADPGGGFTVVWELNGPNFSKRGTYMRRFDAAGTPFDDALRVDPDTATEQRGPVITANGSRGVAVAWARTGDYGANGEFQVDVFARQFQSPLESQIDSGPSGPTKESSPAFTFSSNEPGSTFECQLDADGFSPCASPFLTGPLPDGPHSFEVRASDPDGETELIPESRAFTVDTTAPETFIQSGPAGPTNDTTPIFGFSANEPNVIFECRLDGGAFSQCAEVFTSAAPLGEGPHTFEVRATDQAGNTEPTPAARSFTVDVTSPEVSITSGPAGPIADRTPSFGFSANEAGSSFECQVDLQPALACSSPFTTAELLDGPHILLVWGRDEAGNTGLAFRGFTVDKIVPETSIDSGPAALTNDATPSFGFSANEPASRFECQLDEGGFSACRSPFTAPALPDGFHTFEVRATDLAGNLDQSPAARSFTVDASAPDTVIESGPAGPTNDTTPSFGFLANQPGASFQCRVDGGAYSPCRSPFTAAPLPEGPHSFEVRASDQAENTDPSPALANFTVDTTPPFVRLSARKEQQAGKPIEVKLSCAEDCSVVAGGKIVLRGSGFELRRVAKQLNGGESATLKLGPKNGGAKRRLRLLVTEGMRARAAIELAVTDRAGNTRSVTLKIGLGEPVIRDALGHTSLAVIDAYLRSVAPQRVIEQKRASGWKAPS